MIVDFSKLDGSIWMDRELVPWQQANVHLLTHTLHYGLGVFEGVRAYKTDNGPAIFRLQDHSERLLTSAKIMHIDVPYNAAEISKAQIDTLKANNLDEAYLRPIVYGGSNEVGLRTVNLTYHLAVATWAWPSYLGEDLERNGLSAITSTYSRGSISDGFNRAKVNGGYIANILALKEAINAGCQEAIMLDINGNVCEGSGENIFMVKNDIIYTPFTTSCLDGITRNSIMQLANKHNLSVIERDIGREELWLADEVFLTGTAAEVVPVREIDRRIIGSGARGNITELLQSEYKNAIRGKLPEFEHWLTFIN